MIDVLTRFSQAVIIFPKHKETIANAILKHRMSIFGDPQSILSDNGGEFDNSLLLDVAELLGTKVLTAAAYSLWSSGIVERHNAVITNMILKITRDKLFSGECPYSVLKIPFAITWATALISLCLREIQIYPQCSLQSHQHSVPQQRVS